MRHDDEFGNRPAWVGLFTLPAVLLLVRTSVLHLPVFLDRSLVSVTAVDSPTLVPELIGLVGAAMIAAAVGPHLVGVLATGLLALVWMGAHFVDAPWMAGSLLPTLGMASSVSVLGALAVSAGGGAPGIRYGGFFLAWSAWLTAPYLARGFLLTLETSPIISPVFAAGGLALLATVLLLIPTLSWWFEKRHPRPAAVDATYRVSGIAAVAFAGLVAVHAMDRMRWVHLDALPDPTAFGPLPSLLHSGSAALTALLLAAASVLLQLTRRPARLGVLSGGGCLLLTLAAVWAWTSKGDNLVLVSLLTGIGHALVIPWIWARATTDASWRASTALAAVAVFAPHSVSAMGPTWSITAMIVMVFAAIPASALGQLGDDWVFGDVPGSAAGRRGRR